MICLCFKIPLQLQKHDSVKVLQHFVTIKKKPDYGAFFMNLNYLKGLSFSFATLL